MRQMNEMNDSYQLKEVADVGSAGVLITFPRTHCE